MSQPPYPPQAGPVPQPYQGSAIRFTVQGSVLTASLVAPTLTIDGYRAPTAAGGGSTVIQVFPGPHRLEASSQWLRRYGQATLDVFVPPNSLVEVFYAQPFHQFTTGAMGLTEQPRKGLGCFVITLAVLVGLGFAVALIAIIGN